MVEAVPVVPVERDQEPVRPFQSLQQTCRRPGLPDMIRELGIEVIEDRHVENEVAKLGVLPSQNLLAQVVGDQAIAAARPADECLRVRPVNQRQDGRIDGSGPPLSLAGQLEDGVVEQCDLFVPSNAAVSSRVKERSAARISASLPSTRNRPSRSWGSAREMRTTARDAEACGEVVELLGAGRFSEHLKVVHNVGAGDGLVGPPRCEVAHWDRASTVGGREAGRVRVRVASDQLQGGGHIGPQSRRVVVTRFEVDPGSVFRVTIVGQLGYQRGLAVAGRGGDQQHGLLGGHLDQTQETVPANLSVSAARRLGVGGALQVMPVCSAVTHSPGDPVDGGPDRQRPAHSQSLATAWAFHGKARFSHRDLPSHTKE